MSRGALLVAGLALAGCTGAMPATTGTRPVPLPISAILKTRAVEGARAEIQRSGGNSLGTGVYLDTLVGPTPTAAYSDWAHPREWLDAMVATHQVDGLFGVPSRRNEIHGTAYAIEVGEPFPSGGDTLQIIYDWCTRPFPATRGSAGPASAWRDLFIRADTGWTRVAHLRALIPNACVP